MNKLQAAMKDQNAKRWKAAKSWYRIGSAFAGCKNCGTVDKDTGYLKSGFDVVRAYYPQHAGFTYLCQECGAKDDACWVLMRVNARGHGGPKPAKNLGLEPRILPKYELDPNGVSPYGREDNARRLAANAESNTRRAAPTRREPRLTDRDREIMALQAKLAALEAMLKQ